MKLSINGLTPDDLARLLGGRGRPKRKEKEEAARLEDLPVILFAQTAYQAAVRELTRRKPEAAGVLIGPKDHRSVTHFVPDETGAGTAASFTFDHVRLNEVLRQYVALGLDAKGFCHSHPDGVFSLSGGDLAYVRKAFLNPKNDVREVLMPIVVNGVMYPFIVYPDRAAEARIVLF